MKGRPTLACGALWRGAFNFQATILHAKKLPAKGRTCRRCLSWDSVTHEQGFAGRKESGRTSFAPMPPNSASETCPCQHCGGSARVERYTYTAGKSADPVRMVAVSCLAAKCKQRVVKPETEWPTFPKT